MAVHVVWASKLDQSMACLNNSEEKVEEEIEDFLHLFINETKSLLVASKMVATLVFVPFELKLHPSVHLFYCINQ